MTSKGCANLPLGISRDDVRARGAQVVLVGNCRPGWAADVYSWDDNHVESGSTPDYKPFPACDKTYPRSDYDSKFVRYYEDSTFVATAIDPGQSPAQQDADALTPERVADMTRCGVNLFGFDQLLPNDGRIEASIWSWAKDEPKTRGQAALRRATQGRPLGHASVRGPPPRRLPRRGRLGAHREGRSLGAREVRLPRRRRKLRAAANGLRELAAARARRQPRGLAALQVRLAAQELLPAGRARPSVTARVNGRTRADPAVRRLCRHRRRRGGARGRMAAAQGQEPREAARAGAGAPDPPRARDRAAVARSRTRGGRQQLPPGALRRPPRARGRPGPTAVVGRSRSATTCSRSTRAARVEIDVEAFEAAAARARETGEAADYRAALAPLRRRAAARGPLRGVGGRPARGARRGAPRTAARAGRPAHRRRRHGRRRSRCSSRPWWSTRSTRPRTAR